MENLGSNTPSPLNTNPRYLVMPAIAMTAAYLVSGMFTKNKAVRITAPIALYLFMKSKFSGMN